MGRGSSVRAIGWLTSRRAFWGNSLGAGGCALFAAGAGVALVAAEALIAGRHLRWVQHEEHGVEPLRVGRVQ